MRAPENSLSALRQAIAEGADAAEIDVQRSSDGHVIVTHDRDLRRLAGSPLVISDSTLEQLRTADIGRSIGPQFAGERVATLEEFIDAARGKIRLSVELKYYGRGDPVLAHQVVQALRAGEFTTRANVISLDYAGLGQVRQLDRALPIGFLVSASVGDVTRLDVDFLSVSQSNLTPTLRKHADARGMTIAVWTVNTREDAIRMIARGADDIVTDDPAMAVEAVRWYRELSDVELILLRLREWLRR
jgi:glycerophosphoryl diester phosphodiesterase